jgi:hypothetical protein
MWSPMVSLLSRRLENLTYCGTCGYLVALVQIGVSTPEVLKLRYMHDAKAYEVKLNGLVSLQLPTIV